MIDRYDIEAPVYDQVYDRQDDIPIYLEYFAKTGGPVLECCSGTGRLAIPIARAGFDITGLDLSDKMLRVCRSKLLRESIS
jgi:ubiquinone/menaquinone biosynthesis C-methylase UbiE